MFPRVVVVLLWADVLATYAMWMMMIYLTDVWKLAVTHAATIINVFMGSMSIMCLPFKFLTDTVLGNYWMLVISSLAYCAVHKLTFP